MSGKLPGQLDLQIALWIVNLHAILVGEPFEQVDSLVDQAIPGFSFLVFKGSAPERTPFLEERSRAVVSLEVSRQRLFEAAPEHHRRTRLFFSPAIEVAMPVAAWAAKVLSDLGVAIDHRRSVPRVFPRPLRTKAPPTRLQGQRLPGSGKTGRSRSRERSEQLRADSVGLSRRPGP